MKVMVTPTGSTEVDIAGYQSVAVVVPASSTPRRQTRPARRSRTVRPRRRADTDRVDGMVEITLVRSSRNRLGGGARARPAPAL